MDFPFLAHTVKVERWQGPVSAVIMIWAGHNGRQLPREQISPLVEAVSSSPALQRYLTVHLVFEVGVVRAFMRMCFRLAMSGLYVVTGLSGQMLNGPLSGISSYVLACVRVCVCICVCLFVSPLHIPNDTTASFFSGLPTSCSPCAGHYQQ